MNTSIVLWIRTSLEGFESLLELVGMLRTAVSVGLPFLPPFFALWEFQFPFLSETVLFLLFAVFRLLDRVHSPSASFPAVVAISSPALHLAPFPSLEFVSKAESHHFVSIAAVATRSAFQTPVLSEFSPKPNRWSPIEYHTDPFDFPARFAPLQSAQNSRPAALSAVVRVPACATPPRSPSQRSLSRSPRCFGSRTLYF